MARMMPATELSARLRRLVTSRVRTPLVLQIEATECGAACLASVLRHFGCWVSLEEMRDACDVGRDGCSAADIVRAARQYGLEATGWKQEPEDLPGLPLPAILFWEFRHFVVLEGIGKGKYFLNDPSRGRRWVEEKGFGRGFTGVALELKPGKSFQRTRKPPGVLRRLWPWVSGFRSSLLFSLLTGLLLAVPGVAAPVLLGLFVDDVLQGGQDAWSGPLIGAMAAAAVVVYVLTWLRQRALRRLAITVAVRQADRFVGRLLGRSAQFFARRMSGDLLTRVQSIEQVVAVGVHRLVGVTVDLTMSLAFLSLMFVYDAALAALLVFIALLCGAAARAVSRFRTDESHSLRREQGLWTGRRSGGIAKHREHTVQCIGGRFLRSLDRTSGARAQRPPEISGARSPDGGGSVLFTAVGGAAVLGIGGWRAMSGEIPLGSLIAFYMLAWNFLQPVGRFVQFAELLRTLDAELARLEEVLAAPDTRSAGSPPGASARGHRSGTAPAAWPDRDARCHVRLSTPPASADRGLQPHHRAGPARRDRRPERIWQDHPGAAGGGNLPAVVGRDPVRRDGPRGYSARRPERFHIVREPGTQRSSRVRCATTSRFGIPPFRTRS